MKTLASVAGEWVPDEDMHPVMNIWNREWMTKDGELHGTWRGAGSIPADAYRRGLLWHFPVNS